MDTFQAIKHADRAEMRRRVSENFRAWIQDTCYHGWICHDQPHVLIMRHIHRLVGHQLKVDPPSLPRLACACLRHGVVLGFCNSMHVLCQPETQRSAEVVQIPCLPFAGLTGGISHLMSYKDVRRATQSSHTTSHPPQSHAYRIPSHPWTCAESALSCSPPRRHRPPRLCSRQRDQWPQQRCCAGLPAAYGRVWGSHRQEPGSPRGPPWQPRRPGWHPQAAAATAAPAAHAVAATAAACSYQRPWESPSCRCRCCWCGASAISHRRELVPHPAGLWVGLCRGFFCCCGIHAEPQGAGALIRFCASASG